MTDEERAKAFLDARAEVLQSFNGATADSLRQVLAVLEATEQKLRAELANSPTDWQAYQLPNQLQSIDVALLEVKQALTRITMSAANDGVEYGRALIDSPLAAGGIRVGAVLGDIDLRQVHAIRTFMIDRMSDVSSEAAGKLKSSISLAVTGGKTPADAVSEVAAALKSPRSRAITIVRTEMGRTFSVAGQERMGQASTVLPGLKKQWRRSGKIHSRINHDLADGQIQGVDKPFDLGGPKLMYPRDPEGSASETINCGCVSLPFMDSWQVSHSGRVPFTDRELELNPRKRDLDAALNG